MFKTRVTEMLGIEYPILAGGMGGLSFAELVAAVSNAGGIGILVSAAHPTPEDLRAEIRKIRQLTDKPIGVNISLFPSVRPLPTEGYARVCAEEKVELVETSGVRTPGDLIPLLHAGGVKVMHKCTQVRHAVSAERAGCDLVCVVGYEGGGAKGLDDITTLVLVPATVDAVSIPVVAGGGISDARGFAAVMTLGAEAVVIGTRFMAARECWAHPDFKAALVRAADTDTIVTQQSINNPHRHMRTQASLKVAEMERRGASLEELLTIISGENARRLYETGNLDVGIFSCGQGVGLIHDIPTVKEIIDGMVQGAAEILRRVAPVAVAPA